MPARTPELVWGPLTLLGILFAAMHVALERTTPNAGILGVSARWLFSVNPMVTLFAIVPCAAIYLVLAMQRSPLPLAKVLAVGALVFAVGGVLGFAALATSTSLALWVVALAIMAVGETLAFPLGLTYASLAARTRAATLVIAGWMSLPSLFAFMLGLSSGLERIPAYSKVIVGLAVLVCFAGGVLTLVKAERLHRALADHSKATS